MPLHVRPATEVDAEGLVALRRRLYSETTFMLWEPSEFQATAEDELQFIKRVSKRENSRLLVATHQSQIVAFLAAMGGETNRLKHSANLVLGVAQDHQSRGIASSMLNDVIAWAPTVRLKRLELTVHTSNLKAVALYLRHGFEVEGLSRCSLIVDGKDVDEYLMSLVKF